jgi:hypothetical protein
MPSVEEVRGQALEVALGWSGPEAPRSWRLTAAVFQTIAHHDVLLEAIAQLPPDRLPALLAGAAIAFVARNEPSSELGRYFPTPGRPQPELDAGFHRAIRTFCSTRIDEIVAVCTQHRYQMNEVGRCSHIVCGISATVMSNPAEIDLVDLGTGAGLGLELDKYRYRLGDEVVGPSDASVELVCDVRGEHKPPAVVLPRVVERTGIDLDPVNLEDDAARLWLEACTPPEEHALSRLAASIEVARHERPTIVAGDVLDVLPEVLERLRSDRTLVVVDSYTAVFMSERQRRQLAGVLGDLARRRPVVWLSLDPLVPLGPKGRFSVQGIRVPERLVLDYQRSGVFAVLGARRFDGSSEQRSLLARGHPSGSWIEWLTGRVHSAS